MVARGSVKDADRLSLSVQNVHFSYRAVPVLQGVSFTVPPGGFLGIIGPNGAGKSTLLRLLARTLAPEVGVVRLSGRDLARWSRRDLARTLAVVGQETAVDFAFTAVEVVMMGRHPHQGRFAGESARDREVVEAAMRATGTWELAARPITELSGGERQRVLIARALAQEPEVLLLDEPTAHLDLSYQAEFFALLRAYNRERGLTVVVVLHDLNLAGQYCDQLLLLEGGRVFAAGTPAEVLTTENLTAAYRTPVQVLPGAGGRPLVTLGSAGRGASWPEENKDVTTELVAWVGELLAGRPGLRVHVIGGGGTATALLRELVRQGAVVSVGVLNIGDRDWEVARELGLKLVEAAPFSPIQPEEAAANAALMREAQVIVVSDVPFGPGNLVNLEAVAQAQAAGVPVWLLEETPVAARDYTGGKMSALYTCLVAQGAKRCCLAKAQKPD